MTDIEYYRFKRLMPRMRGLMKEYPVHTIENIVRQLEDRLQHHENNKKSCKRNKRKS